jgi:hypothetical protein
VDTNGGVLEPINVRDVRMIERREKLRLALEAGAAVASPDTASGSTFSATSRLSLVSRAR